MKFKVLFSGGKHSVVYAPPMLKDIAEVEAEGVILSEDELQEKVKDIDALVAADTTRVTRRVIQVADRLKIIAFHGAGYDAIDVKAATEKRIPVTYCPGVVREAVPEYVIGMMINISRGFLLADMEMRKGNWSYRDRLIDATQIEGKTLGIIGLGAIGGRLAQRAGCFDMRVLAYDPFVKPEKAAELGVKLVDLHALLRESDYISINAQLTDQTRGLISETQLKMMKKTGYLINAARGPIVDGKALYRALKEGWIKGAVLDVYEVEPPDFKDPLFELENVIVTPHLAGITKEGRRALGEAVANNVRRVLLNQPPIKEQTVNPEVLK